MEEPISLTELVEKISDAADHREKITVDNILDSVGRRSFGPILVVTGLITVAPLIGDIPGMPTIMGTIIVLTAVQLLFGKDHFWLPQFILKRSVSHDKLCKAVNWLRKPAHFLDRFTKPRITFLTKKAGVKIVSLVSIIIAGALPAMEFIPFSANLAGFAFTMFGLSLIAHDGLLALISFLATIGIFVLLAVNIF